MQSKNVIAVSSMADITQTSALCPLSNRTGPSGCSSGSDDIVVPLLLAVDGYKGAFAWSGAANDAREADGLALRRHIRVEFEAYVRGQNITYALQRKYSVHLTLHPAIRPSLSFSPGGGPLMRRH